MEDKFKFWQETLKGARLVVAPMVDASELAWRMLSRRYGAELCFTPMLHSAVLVRDPRYRRDSLQSCEGDRPLIVQLCGNDPDTVGRACALVAPHCDAIDINLGCPQAIAKKGRYGAFLMDDLALVRKLVESAVASSSVPVTCKIRVFPDKQKTVSYALMLQEAGASLLTVHGRTREQKGPLTGLADWSYITAVREAVSVPVFANGNIQYRDDVDKCLNETGVQGVMSAEGNLHNPALFSDPCQFPGRAPTVWRMALEYLELVKLYPCPISYTRGHLFKLFHHCFSMSENSDIRQVVSRCSTVDQMVEAVETLKRRMEPYHSGEKAWNPENKELANLPFPPWLCQPYVRIPPEQHIKKCEQQQLKAKEKRTAEQNGLKRPHEEEELTEKEVDLLQQNSQMGGLSKKKAKKLLRNPKKKFIGCRMDSFDLCVCRSPRGGKCEYLLCKACCKSKCYRDDLDCSGHRIWVKTSRIKATTLPPKEDKHGTVSPKPENVHGFNSPCRTNLNNIAEAFSESKSVNSSEKNLHCEINNAVNPESQPAVGSENIVNGDKLTGL